MLAKKTTHVSFPAALKKHWLVAPWGERGHFPPCLARTWLAYVLACRGRGLENEIRILLHVLTGAMDVGEKIMESWAVPDVQRFETRADDKAKGATLCMGTRQERRAQLRAPWTTKCQLKHTAADGQAFVSVAGHSQARVAVEAHPETFQGPGDCPQHRHVVALGDLCPLSPPQNTPKAEWKCISGETDEREAPCPCRRSTRLQPLVGPWHGGRADVPLTGNARV